MATRRGHEYQVFVFGAERGRDGESLVGQVSQPEHFRVDGPLVLVTLPVQPEHASSRGIAADLENRVLAGRTGVARPGSIVESPARRRELPPRVLKHPGSQGRP